MAQLLPYIQVILSIVLIGTILLQRSEAGLGAGFGGDGIGAGQYERRGLERTLFRITLLVAFLYVLSTLMSLFVR